MAVMMTGRFDFYLLSYEALTRAMIEKSNAIFEQLGVEFGANLLLPIYTVLVRRR
jgi:hypothetical protein